MPLVSVRKFRKINELLLESGPLARPNGRERMARIQMLLGAMDDLARQLNVTSLRLHAAGFRTLTLSVPDGASATRLRYENRTLLNAIRQCAGLDFARVAVRVDPGSAGVLRPSPPPRRPQRAAAGHLQTAANGIDDPGLRSALLRLADRMGRPNKLEAVL